MGLNFALRATSGKDFFVIKLAVSDETQKIRVIDILPNGGVRCNISCLGCTGIKKHFFVVGEVSRCGNGGTTDRNGKPINDKTMVSDLRICDIITLF